MEYYLETNSLRQLISKVDIEFIRKSTFTSILALMEIASGIIDEKSFQLRKAILSKFLNSKLTFCVNLPETVYFNAFGFNLNDKKMTDGIGRVLFRLIETDTYEVFVNQIEDSDDKDYFTFLREFDSRPPRIFRENFSDHIDQARKEPGFKALIEEFSKRWNSKDPFFAEEFYNVILDYYVAQLHNHQKEITPHWIRSVNEIKNSYDHSIDIFLIMSSLYSDQRISHGSLPAKNDYFDLSHMIYLDDLSMKIVTDDKLFHQLFIHSFSQNILTVKSFIQKISI